MQFISDAVQQLHNSAVRQFNSDADQHWCSSAVVQFSSGKVQQWCSPAVPTTSHSPLPIHHKTKHKHSAYTVRLPILVCLVGLVCSLSHHFRSNLCRRPKSSSSCCCCCFAAPELQRIVHHHHMCVQPRAQANNFNQNDNINTALTPGEIERGKKEEFVLVRARL